MPPAAWSKAAAVAMYEYGRFELRGTNHALPAGSMAIASTLSACESRWSALA